MLILKLKKIFLYHVNGDTAIELRKVCLKRLTHAIAFNYAIRAGILMDLADKSHRLVSEGNFTALPPWACLHQHRRKDCVIAEKPLALRLPRI